MRSNALIAILGSEDIEPSNDLLTEPTTLDLIDLIDLDDLLDEKDPLKPNLDNMRVKSQTFPSPNVKSNVKLFFKISDQ